MSIEIVQGELERLFSLEEMMSLSADLLGFDPKDVGGVASKASFARALSDRCAECDALDALVDAVLASSSEVDPRLRKMRGSIAVPPEELKPGAVVGPF